jgi:hypothetical protein
VPNNRDRGKAAERAVANLLGGKRIGTMSGEDVHFDGPWSAEVKSRAAFVACAWVDQAVRNAPPGKTPLVVVHVRGKRHGEDLVILRLADWQDWHGTGGGNGAAGF